MRNLEPRRRRWIQVRIAILAVFLLAGAGMVLRRAYELQVERGATLREMAEEQYLKDVRLAPKRGTIYDRHGAELAVSVDVESAWANPRQLRAEGFDPAETARRLAGVLDIDVERITQRLSSDRYFVWIKRRLTPREAARVRGLEIPAVYMDHEARRYYPNQQLAAHVLGFANVDGRGIEGLELSLDEQLRGTVASVPAIRDRRGRVVFSEQLLDGSSQQGTDVYLTIDKTIQTIAERELELAVRTFEARAGSVVVMDPTTGELLAVANFPTYNPNDPGRYDPAHRRNRAVTDYFEPGSTVKPFTVAGALAAGTVRTDQLIDCEDGAMQVAEYTIHDSTPYGELTPAQILAHSSNIGTAKIGSSMGRAGLFRTYRRFGFGERTDIPLPGEASGILRHYRRWYEMDAATISFGQGMSSTNLQLASAMSAIANGGQLMRPILVRRTADPGGNATEDTVPQVRRRVVPRAVARLVGDMLTAVTGPDGTGAEAAIEGYLVAGKTGTAQKADYVHGGYAQDQWLASFVGFVPAQDPRLVISVIIDEPVIAYYGGAVAGPVFRRVGEASLRHLGVPAEAGGEALVAHARERREREADEARRRREARAEAGGEPGGEPGGDGADAAPDTALARAEPGAGETRVPDVLGRTARGALRALREASLSVEITGTGLVDAVEPPVGAIVPVGASVLVLLTPPNREVLPVAPAGPELARSDTHRVAGEARP